jgi:TolB-like protein/DNA-binding winged helix-turn-helix (wHTH) protein/Tfp pilus assembly protein PilF
MPTDQTTRTVFAFGPFGLDSNDLVLLKNDVEIPLTRKAIETLLVLVQNAGHVVTKENLLSSVWPGTFVNEATLAQNILTLRKALGRKIDGEEYIATVPKRGYRFQPAVTQVARQQSGASTQIVRQIQPATIPSVLSVRHSSRYALPAITVVIVLSSMYLMYSRGRLAVAENTDGKIHSLAVLSLTNMSGDASQDYIADGITEAVTTDLAKFRSLRVVSRTSAMQYNGRKKPLPQIARELHVDAIVEGGVMRSGGRVRITAQLVKAENDRQIWAESYERELRDVLALQNEIAGDIAERVQAQITAEDRQRLATARILNPAAHEEYLKGRFFWNKRTESGYMDAIDHFQRAIRIDPDYPEPYAGMADAYALLGSLGGASIPRREAMNNARSSARKALALDPALAEAHTSLAFVLMHYDWDFAAAEKEFLRAIDLNPSYATAHQWHAINLAATGQMDAALTEIRHAQELDPLSLVISADIGEFLCFARRYDDAVTQLQGTLKMDPSFLLGHLNSVAAYHHLGKYAEAEAHARKALELAPNSMWAQGVLAQSYALAGQKREARALMDRIEHSAHGKENAHNLAITALALGDKDLAFHWLQVANQERSGSLILLKVVPYYDPLRADPRFVTMLKSVGLEPSATSQ